ncbi:MAG TPA: hypothetical protein VJ828_05205 [Lacipirellulaceae bacterium]|nr:hypothetical protein [Lacipirellulaceae bacterium]
MDCDQVFMILTRGPFPTGAACDEDVEAHLETCGDCWRLAEALRPALEVFQEAVPPAESRDLPGYWGDARPASAVMSDLANGAGRTLVARGVRRRAPARELLMYGPQTGVSSEVFRAIAVAATLTAAAVSFVLLLRG